MAFGLLQASLPGYGQADSLRNVLAGASVKDSLAILNSLGQEYFKQDLYDEALEVYFIMLRTARRHESQKALGDAYNNIGRIYYNLENYDLALSYYQKSLRQFIREKDEISQGGLFNNIGLVMYELDFLDSALYNYFKALEIKEKSDNTLDVASIYHNIALVYNLQHKTDSAIVFLKRSEAIFKELKDRKLTANTLNNIGRAYYKLKDLEPAFLYFDSAYALAAKINAPFIIMDNYRYKADGYLEQKDYKMAFYFINLYHHKKDSLFSIENKKQLNEIRTRYESEIKERENALLKQENMNNGTIIRQQYIAGAAIIITALLLAVLLFIYYRSFTQKHKANKLLETQKIEIEAQNQKLAKLNDEISGQKASLEHLNQVKDTLFSIISHEFKSPLNSLKGTLSLLMADAITGDELKKLSTDISGKLNNISIFLENLLHWAKSQMKGIEPQPEPVELLPLITDNINLLKPQASGKGIHVEVNIPDQDLKVYSDHEMSRLVFRNLISNAIKFTRKNGLIKIDAVRGW